MKVRETMTRSVISIAEDDTLEEAYELMTGYDIRHLPVVDDNGHLRGVLSERDILKRSSFDGNVFTVAKVSVGDVMHRDVITCQVGTTIAEAATLMIENKISCLPVVSGTEIVGMITTTDLLDLHCRKDEAFNHQVLPYRFTVRPYKKGEVSAKAGTRHVI